MANTEEAQNSVWYKIKTYVADAYGRHTPIILATTGIILANGTAFLSLLYSGGTLDNRLQEQINFTWLFDALFPPLGALGEYMKWQLKT